MISYVLELVRTSLLAFLLWLIIFCVKKICILWYNIVFYIALLFTCKHWLYIINHNKPVYVLPERSVKKVSILSAEINKYLFFKNIIVH